MNEKRNLILCIEDDRDTCELITFVFKQEGREITTCNQTDCLGLIQEERFAAIILDNYFNELKGTEICREIRTFDQHVPIIFFSGEARELEIEKAFAAGANEYLVKPNDFEKLVPTTIKLVEESKNRLKIVN